MVFLLQSSMKCVPEKEKMGDKGEEEEEEEGSCFCVL